MFDFLWRSVVVGAGATAAMDLWALALYAVFGLALPNWAMVGRWFAHVAKGRVYHKNIADSAPVGLRIPRFFRRGFSA
jgi:Protein of unknown function (DUF2938)